MLILAVTAALLSAQQPPQVISRRVLDEICLPFVTSGAADPVAAMEFVPTADDGETRQFVSPDDAWLLRLTISGTAEDGDLTRLCVLQARRGGLQAVRDGVAGPLEAAGFVADAEMPADRPIWTRGGITVSLRQNEGRATLMRVSWSALDEG